MNRKISLALALVGSDERPAPRRLPLVVLFVLIGVMVLAIMALRPAHAFASPDDGNDDAVVRFDDDDDDDEGDDDGDDDSGDSGSDGGTEGSTFEAAGESTDGDSRGATGRTGDHSGKSDKSVGEVAATQDSGSTGTTGTGTTGTGTTGTNEVGAANTDNDSAGTGTGNTGKSTEGTLTGRGAHTGASTAGFTGTGETGGGTLTGNTGRSTEGTGTGDTGASTAGFTGTGDTGTTASAAGEETGDEAVLGIRFGNALEDSFKNGKASGNAAVGDVVLGARVSRGGGERGDQVAAAAQSEGGVLPFTGVQVGAMLAAAAGFIGSGAYLWRKNH